MSPEASSDNRNLPLVSTGIAGLDEALRGGLPAGRAHLLEGSPGSGKTTLAMQFLLAGGAAGERCVLVSLSETAADLRASAATHGWDLDGIEVLECLPSAEEFERKTRYTMFHPAEVELGETMRSLIEALDRLEPTRVAIDSVSELRLLADSPLRYRREILALKSHLARQKATVLLLDDRMDQDRDMSLHTLTDGAIALDWEAAGYGPMRRRLRITKLRGQAFSEGAHDLVIRTGGLQVFPRLVAAEHEAVLPLEALPSDSDALDALLGGGVPRGTSALIVGPAGVGKSTLATQYARAAAERGETSSIFLFDESVATLMQRSSGLGQGLGEHIEQGRMRLRRIDPAEMSPGEFAWNARLAAEDSTVIVIDSLTGYLQAMPDQRFLSLHLHELLTFLGQRGVTTLLVVGQHGVLGSDTSAAVDASYLADTVILMRNFESRGEVRKAISVAKKRTGDHERTVREYRIANGITVGETLRDLEGVLTGWPRAVTGLLPETED